MTELNKYRENERSKAAEEKMDKHVQMTIPPELLACRKREVRENPSQRTPRKEKNRVHGKPIEKDKKILTLAQKLVKEYKTCANGIFRTVWTLKD